MNFSPLPQDSEPGAPQRSRTFSYDVNQQANSLVRWEQHYDQHSNGIFTGYLDELTLKGVHFFEEFTSQSLTQQCCVNENSLWLGFSLQPEGLKINGKNVQDSQLMIRPSGVEFELLTPENFNIFGLVIDRAYLKEHMIESDAQQWFEQGSTSLLMEKNSHVSYELAKLIKLFLNNQSPLGADALQTENKEALSRISRLKPLITSKIVDLLLQAKPSDEQVSLSHLTKKRIIEKIDNYIEATGQYPLTISELCKIAYVSRRTLQYCFESEFGCSPIQYLRDCRLNEIRRILLTPNSDLVIADVALEYGFYHISTFNAHYKRLFGETPSQTMSRAGTYKNFLITTQG